MTEARAQDYLAAARTAVSRFPVDVATCDPVGVSENITFRVTDHEGACYALRLHRPGYNSLRALESERHWCAALARSGLWVQAPVTSRDGGLFVTVVVDGGGEKRLAGMTSWLQGELLSDHLPMAGGRERRRLFHELGQQAASLHNQSARWHVPAGFERPALDEEGLLGGAPRWGCFWEHAALNNSERSLLLSVAAHLRRRLEHYGKHSAIYGLIHADMHAENVVLGDSRLGLIDFDDCAFGWHAYDLASALIEEHAASDFAAVQQALLDGYREHRPFSSREDESMLADFLLIRGMALLGWYHQRPEQEEGDFFFGVRDMVVEQCRRYHEPR